MEITPQLIDRLAELSKLEFSPEEKERLMNDLDKIFSMVEKLQEVNVDGVAPLVYLTEERNRLRADIPAVTVSREDALTNAPQGDSDYFKVPKVIRQKS